jgi:acyl carrier protein
MNQNKIEQVIDIVRKATKNTNIDTHSSMQNTNGWDSLAYLVILQELEDVFELKLSSENINSFGSIKEIIESLNEM